MRPERSCSVRLGRRAASSAASGRGRSRANQSRTAPRARARPRSRAMIPSAAGAKRRRAGARQPDAACGRRLAGRTRDWRGAVIGARDIRAPCDTGSAPAGEAKVAAAPIGFRTVHPTRGMHDERPVHGRRGRPGRRIPPRGARRTTRRWTCTSGRGRARTSCPRLLAGYDFVLDDHTQMPTEVMRRCTGLKHVIFLGTGARSYMDPEELADARHHRPHHQGLRRHRGRRARDRPDVGGGARPRARWTAAMRAGGWLRTEGPQLTGKTIGLIGFGGIAAEVARIAGGVGMRVLAWNRTPKAAPGRRRSSIWTRCSAESHVLSLHLLLTDETRGFLGAERIGAAAARRDPGEHRARRARRRGGDDRRAARGPDRPRRRSTCSTIEPLPAGPRADHAGERHAVGAQRLPHAGGERDAAPPGAGHRARDCASLVELLQDRTHPSWSAKADHPRLSLRPRGSRGWSAFADHDEEDGKPWPAWRNGRRSGLKIRGPLAWGFESPGGQNGHHISERSLAGGRRWRSPVRPGLRQPGPIHCEMGAFLN